MRRCKNCGAGEGLMETPTFCKEGSYGSDHAFEDPPSVSPSDFLPSGRPSSGGRVADVHANCEKIPAGQVMRFVRLQILTAIEHWKSTGKTPEQLEFRIRTMALALPQGDERDEARIERIKNGHDA